MIYSTNFFKHRQEQVLASAGPIVEHLFNLIKPETALDIGCATGIWLAQAQKKGCGKNQRDRWALGPARTVRNQRNFLFRA